jgi:hypothetical protein
MWNHSGFGYSTTDVNGKQVIVGGTADETAAIKALQQAIKVAQTGALSEGDVAIFNKHTGLSWAGVEITGNITQAITLALQGKASTPWYKDWKILVPIALGGVVVVGGGVYAARTRRAQ